MTIQAALHQGSRLLEEAPVHSPRLTAEVLLCHTLGCERSWLYGHSEEELSESSAARYHAYLRQRLEGTPTQYITGQQEFFGRAFRVTPDVLIPRPETEHVVEKALAVGGGAVRMVDVGCGSGILAVTLRLESRAEVWATDVSLAALAVAAGNARRLGAEIRIVACDLASALADRSVGLVVSNPPYIPLGDLETLPREVRDHEPPAALFAGETGLEVYERLIADAARVLRPDGWLVVELGAGERVRRMLGPVWRDFEVTPDLAGIPRVLAARYAP